MQPDALKFLVSYDPETGSFTWRRRARDAFGNDRAWNRWNACYADTPAFATPDAKGYLTGKLLGKRLRAHRIAWAISYGEWPDEIDHINGDRADNRLANLRAVTHAENCRNFGHNAANKTGWFGIFQRPSGNWGAKIGKAIIGTFPTKSEAIAARKQAERDHDYHINHGRKFA